ncbi:MAG TPA: glycosyltransferase family 39 protein [Gaiellaceae bacterium]|nr:glycosyltransferase family 39 protein [Gaiellaceae bacterium]
MSSAAVAPETPLLRSRSATGLAATLACGALAAAVQAAVVAPFLGRYGWDRDELYFLSAARRPTWGYVDFPPLTAWIGWLVHTLFGDSLVALRLTSLAAMLGATVLVALIARELGAGPPTQVAATLAWALSPYALGAGSLFHPIWLDALCWVALLYVVLLALGRERPRLWLVAGAIAGVGLEAKYTIAVVLLALGAALLATRERRLLGTRWPWLGLTLALALLLPNLIWQAEHGWPSVHFAASQNAKTAADTPPATYLAEQLFLGAGLVLAAIGVAVLWRRERLRPLALVPPLVTVFFLLERGRAYYPLPADAIAVAAGVTGLAAWLRAGSRSRLLVLAPLVALQVATLALAAPIVVPVRGTTSMIASGVWKQSFYKDELGWPELADQTAHAWRSLTVSERAHGAIVAGNYGEASALELYGHARGLPPVLSGHLSWQYWRPRALPQRFVLFVGYEPSNLRALCRSWRPLATVDNRWHLDNEERGRTIAACRLGRPLGAIWNTDIATNSL